MRILMVNHEFTITGASTVFLRLATHLQAQGHDLHLLPVNVTDGPIKPRYAELGIPVVLSATLAEFDLAIANTICAAPTLIKIAPRLPVIWFLHETEIALNLLLKNNGWIAAFRMAAAIVYQTPFQHDVFRSFTYQLDPAKFHVVPNGVDIDPDTFARDRIAPRGSKLRVVQVGSVEGRKRPGDLIMAVARSRLDLECILCGKVFGLDKPVQAIVAREPERFRLLGETEPAETLAWMESADMYCLASASESQPISVFEAALLARPLLLSDLPGYRDVFTHGRNCLMFPPGHVDMLSILLTMYAGSEGLRKEMGQAAQRTARRFGNALFLDRFDGVIRTVMAGVGSRPPAK